MFGNPIWELGGFRPVVNIRLPCLEIRDEDSLTSMLRHLRRSSNIRLPYAIEQVLRIMIAPFGHLLNQSEQETEFLPLLSVKLSANEQ